MRKRECNVKLDAFKERRAKYRKGTGIIAAHLMHGMRRIRKALANRRGIALALVLWLVAILALIAAGLSWTARSEVRIAALQQDGVRALYLARAGIAHVLHLLAQDEQPYFDAYTESWAFVDSAQGGIFDDEYGRYVVRVEDEAGKLNINVASRDELLTFFQGDESIVDAILDWRDEDDVPNPSGAESDYYQSLPLPYQCRNAPFETIHELLLVRGMTPDLFYSGFTELMEGAYQASYGTKTMGTSFKELLTVYAAVPNVSPDGQPLINLNTASREEMQEALGDVLTDEEIDAIIRFRESEREQRGGEGAAPSGPSAEAPSQPPSATPQGPAPRPGASGQPPSGPTQGPTSPRPGSAGAGMPPSGPPASSGAAPRRQAQLSGSTGRPPSGEAPEAPSSIPSEGTAEFEQQPRGQATTGKFESLADLLRVPGLSADKARMILDRVTIWDEPARYGVININTAPLEVLMCIPGMTEAVANDIISFRESSGAFESLGQLLELPSMDEETFRQLIDRIAIRSQVFRITAIGWVPSSGARHVIECIIERIPPQPVEEGEGGEVSTSTYAPIEQSNAMGVEASMPTFVVRYWRER